MAYLGDAVGSVAVVDLEAACELYGRDALPYPLGRTRPVGSVWLLTRDVGPVEDRLRDGDLRGVRGWVKDLARTDVSVSCRVSCPESDAPDRRLHAMVAGQSGYLAVQRTASDGVDTVDIYALWPGETGAAIAELIGLTGPGAHARIAVTGCGDQLPEPAVDEYDALGFAVSDTGSGALVVDGDEVSAIGTIDVRDNVGNQSLHWVTVRDDGDYLYAADDGYAEPIDAVMLRRTLDELIGAAELPTSADGELSFLEPS